MLEAGTVRQKNVTEIIIKNISDVNVAGLAFWAFGYAIAVVPSGNGFAGGKGAEALFLHNINEYGGETSWFFHWCFVSTCTSIVSGAVAERCKMICYVSFAALMSAIVYPVVAYWAWSTSGWLSPFNPDTSSRIGVGVIDFAGSGVVHITGGMSALIGAYIVGPRADHFYRTASGEVRAREYTANSQVARAIGVFTLWFGWYFFNGGTAFSLDYGSDKLVTIASRAVVNTTISSCSGSVMASILTIILSSKQTEAHTSGEFFNALNKAISNGVLAGLVSITSGCAVVSSYGAFVIGAVGSLAMMASTKLLVLYEIDDVVQAVPVHLVCGIWGVIAPALMAIPGHCDEVYGHSTGGFLYGGDGTLLLASVLFIFCTIAWVSATIGPFFVFFKAIGLVRYSDKEIENIDILDERYHGSMPKWKDGDYLVGDTNGGGRLPIRDAYMDEESIASDSEENAAPSKTYATSARSLDSSTRGDSDHAGVGGVEMLLNGNVRSTNLKFRRRNPQNGDSDTQAANRINTRESGSPQTVRRLLNPGDIEAYVASKTGNSLDRTNLLALAISHNATDQLMDLLDAFDHFSGGSSQIVGAQVQEFVDRIRVQSTALKLR